MYVSIHRPKVKEVVNWKVNDTTTHESIKLIDDEESELIIFVDNVDDFIGSIASTPMMYYTRKVRGVK